MYETHVRYLVLEGMDVDDEITSTSFWTFARVSEESVGQSVKR